MVVVTKDRKANKELVVPLHINRRKGVCSKELEEEEKKRHVLNRQGKKQYADVDLIVQDDPL